MTLGNVLCRYPKLCPYTNFSNMFSILLSGAKVLKLKFSDGCMNIMGYNCKAFCINSMPNVFVTKWKELDAFKKISNESDFWLHTVFEWVVSRLKYVSYIIKIHYKFFFNPNVHTTYNTINFKCEFCLQICNLENVFRGIINIRVCKNMNHDER